MLEDRDYMRAEPPRPGALFSLSVSVWLISINFVLYAVQLIFPLATRVGSSRGVLLEHYLALFPPDLLRGQLWELLTFQFLHAGPMHLVMNCLLLYFFGRPLESELGRRPFLWLYLGTGAAGGLLQAICGLLLPSHFGLAPTVGASAGVFGLIATFAMLHREQLIHLLFPPVAIKAKWLLVFETVLALFGMLRPDQIAHAAHLGGIIAGVAFARYLQNWRWRMPRGTVRPARASALEIVSDDPVRSAPKRQSAKTVAKAAAEDDFMAREVDPILEKISAQGIQSLTEDEKRILETARHRMTLR